MCEVFRPIDEELTRLNQPVVAIVEDDIDVSDEKTETRFLTFFLGLDFGRYSS